MINRIKKHLDGFQNTYKSIVQQGLKYIENNSNIDENNTLNIFHRPWIATKNWGIVLYDSVKSQWIKDFTKRTGKEVPHFYKNFLKNMNGAFIYDMSLFGLPTSIYKKGVISRSVLQCHDLTIANTNWILEYNINKNAFHFGSRAYTYDENVGYFYLNNDIICVRTNGEIIDKWNDFSQFLNDEIEKAEKMMLDEKSDDIKIIIK